jgi:cell cycle checkpoint protein
MDLGKGDPPNPSASAKDIQREKDLDDALFTAGEASLPLPAFLSHHERRMSRVDVDVRPPFLQK